MIFTDCVQGLTRDTKNGTGGKHNWKCVDYRKGQLMNPSDNPEFGNRYETNTYRCENCGMTTCF